MTLGTGIHLGVAPELYHADPCIVPSLSSSIAQVLMRESPYKAWFSHPRLNNGFIAEDSGKFDIGTAAHALLLEGIDKMHVCHFDDWRKKAAQEERDAARSVGEIPVLTHQAAALQEMVAAARTFIDNSEVADEWRDGDSEVTVIAQESGTWLRARFDRIAKSRRVIFDYKTTTEAAPEQFGRQLLRMGYHIQEAFYRHVAALCKLGTPHFVFVAQSVEPPYECSLHGCDPALQEISDAKVEETIALWRKCLKDDKWPSYPARIHWCNPPVWMMAEHEQRLQEAA